MKSLAILLEQAGGNVDALGVASVSHPRYRAAKNRSKDAETLAHTGFSSRSDLLGTCACIHLLQAIERRKELVIVLQIVAFGIGIEDVVVDYHEGIGTLELVLEFATVRLTQVVAL